MANSTVGNPFILDTATDTAIFTDDFLCYAIAWTSASTADAISIQTSSSDVKYASTGSVANYSERFVLPGEHPLRFNGLKVPTLGSGKVYMYVKVLG